MNKYDIEEDAFSEWEYNELYMQIEWNRARKLNAIMISNIYMIFLWEEEEVNPIECLSEGLILLILILLRIHFQSCYCC